MNQQHMHHNHNPPRLPRLLLQTHTNMARRPRGLLVTHRARNDHPLRRGVNVEAALREDGAG